MVSKIKSRLSKPKKAGNAHFSFFSSSFDTKQAAIALLRLALNPKRLATIDLRTTRIENRNWPQKGLLKAGEADLVVSARLKDDPQILAYFVFEHKSSPDRGLMQQLLKYQTLIYLYEEEADAVVPITVYHGRRMNWSVPHSYEKDQMKDVPESFLLKFNDILINFGMIMVNLHDADVKQQWSKFSLKEQLSFEVLAGIWEADEHTYLELYKRAKPLPDKVRKELLSRIAIYLMNVHKHITMETLDKHVYEQLGEDMIMELTGEELRKAAYRYFMDEEKAEKLLSQGEKKGIKKGIKKGEKVGIKKGEKVGIKKGREISIEETASRMIERGFTDEDIISATTLPLERINTLRNGF